MDYGETINYILKEMDEIDLRLLDKEKVIKEFENELKKKKATN